MPDDYNLPRHTAESSRLDKQHEVYTKIIGYAIHPHIAATLPENARIADVGTGTGVWLQKLAKTCPPTWTLHGLDISTAQFPQDTAQARIKFEQLNITEAIPERQQGKFDVVHLRLLVCGLNDQEWTVAARNVLRLLKPGGWIQWEESQFRNMQMFQNVPGASIKHNQRLIRAVISSLNRQGKMLDHVLQLCETVQSAGFEDCGEDVFSSDRAQEVRERLNDVQFGAIESLAKVLAEKDPETALTSQQVDEESKRSKEELEDGKAYYHWTMRVVTGRRPA